MSDSTLAALAATTFLAVRALVWYWSNRDSLFPRRASLQGLATRVLASFPRPQDGVDELGFSTPLSYLDPHDGLTVDLRWGRPYATGTDEASPGDREAAERISCLGQAYLISQLEPIELSRTAPPPWTIRSDARITCHRRAGLWFALFESGTAIARLANLSLDVAALPITERSSRLLIWDGAREEQEEVDLSRLAVKGPDAPIRASWYGSHTTSRGDVVVAWDHVGVFVAVSFSARDAAGRAGSVAYLIEQVSELTKGVGLLFSPIDRGVGAVRALRLLVTGSTSPSEIGAVVAGSREGTTFIASTGPVSTSGAEAPSDWDSEDVAVAVASGAQRVELRVMGLLDPIHLTTAGRVDMQPALGSLEP